MMIEHPCQKPYHDSIYNPISQADLNEPDTPDEIEQDVLKSGHLTTMFSTIDDFTTFYYYTNTSLRTLLRSYIAYVTIGKKILRTVGVVVDDTEMETYVIEQLKETGFLPSPGLARGSLSVSYSFLYFNDGTILEFVKVYLAVQRIVDLIVTNKKLLDKQWLTGIYRTHKQLFNLTRECIDDTKNMTTKVRTVMSVLPKVLPLYNKRKLSASLLRLIECQDVMLL